MLGKYIYKRQMNRKISICIEQIKSTTRHIQDDYIIIR